ncbi:unknown [Prevotella sp. CAG:755]|nr:unknown [Prevotella sp. CAG:755]
MLFYPDPPATEHGKKKAKPYHHADGATGYFLSPHLSFLSQRLFFWSQHLFSVIG